MPIEILITYESSIPFPHLERGTFPHQWEAHQQQEDHVWLGRGESDIKAKKDRYEGSMQVHRTNNAVFGVQELLGDFHHGMGYEKPGGSF